MKWLVLSEHPWLRGGLQSRTIELSFELLQEGHQVDFLCFGTNPYQDLNRQFAGQSVVHPTFGINNRSIRPRHSWSAVRTLRQICPDVIFFCNTPVPSFFPFVFAARRCGVKNVVIHHGTDVEFPQPSGTRLFGFLPRPGLWRKELIASARFAYKNVTLALFNNNVQMQNWQAAVKYSPAVCQLWYPPMDLSRFRRCDATRQRIRRDLGLSDSFVVGGVGRLCQQKSFDVAVQALDLALPRIPNAQLVLVGEGPEEAPIRQLIRERGLDGRVKLLGERSDVDDVMNSFDVFCLPSTEANETLGIVILEAMATQVPVVVTDLPGPRRLAADGRCALVVKRGDPRALAEALVRLSDNKNLRDQLVRESQAVVAECDRSTVVRRILDRLEPGNLGSSD
jgi:glycosyltransferase involved in cell wall biosynthesis